MTKLLLTLYKEQNSCCSIHWGSSSCHFIPTSTMSLHNVTVDTGTNEPHHLLQHLLNFSRPVRGQNELSTISFADVMEDIRWCITKTSFLFPHCFTMSLVYITVSLPFKPSPAVSSDLSIVSHLSPNLPPPQLIASDCKMRLWKFPCSHSPSHQDKSHIK